MGCFCCKVSAIEDDGGVGPPKLAPATATATFTAGSGRSSSARVVVKEAATVVYGKSGNGVATRVESSERKRERQAYVQHLRQTAGMGGSVPRAAEGEQVSAGWPSWLASVAGEAIRGWVPRRADSFEKLDKVCSSFSSSFFFLLFVDFSNWAYISMYRTKCAAFFFLLPIN